jgi:hypothetical protein
MEYKILKVANSECVVMPDGRIYALVKPYKPEGGYPVLKIARQNYSVHRLLAESFIPNPDNKPDVNHINGLKDDFRLENLEWCTRKENIDHYYQVIKLKRISPYRRYLWRMIALPLGISSDIGDYLVDLINEQSNGNQQ